MKKSLEQIAQDLREAYVAGAGEGMGILGSFFADKIEILHEPIQRGDGLWNGADWVKAEHGAIRALEKGVIGFRQDVVVTVIGADQIGTQNTMSGKLPDGTPLLHKVRSVLTFKDGKIVKSLSYTESGSESGQLLTRALMAVPEFIELTKEIVRSREAAN